MKVGSARIPPGAPLKATSEEVITMTQQQGVYQQTLSVWSTSH